MNAYNEFIQKQVMKLDAANSLLKEVQSSLIKASLGGKLKEEIFAELLEEHCISISKASKHILELQVYLLCPEFKMLKEQGDEKIFI
ncbi:hypothetical protein [Veillonella sp. R32]|uniref:hypothetical protein n=1 Tax=Veillonella sp. R32 TaxID=2021312 RepID=UPI001389F999|nr:hypothetical protein [Veillonella sp. R32]KAF1680477.1 hypothetical protein VER_08560 [Veillonella sp. R32]